MGDFVSNRDWGPSTEMDRKLMYQIMSRNVFPTWISPDPKQANSKARMSWGPQRDCIVLLHPHIQIVNMRDAKGKYPELCLKLPPALLPFSMFISYLKSIAPVVLAAHSMADSVLSCSPSPVAWVSAMGSRQILPSPKTSVAEGRINRKTWRFVSQLLPSKSTKPRIKSVP